MKKTANQIADEVIEKVAMPYKGMIKSTKQMIKTLTGFNDAASRKALKESQKFLKEMEAAQSTAAHDLGSVDIDKGLKSVGMKPLNLGK